MKSLIRPKFWFVHICMCRVQIYILASDCKLLTDYKYIANYITNTLQITLQIHYKLHYKYITNYITNTLQTKQGQKLSIRI